MTLQQDIEKKILANENDELRNLLFEFINDVDEKKISVQKLKIKVLQDVREIVLDEIGG
ncbi:hypothetical protein ACN6J9_06560 [Carnobacterium maltaromaticum]|uniref:hypothetical protein n=1 Tax=Carnobacterium maltaromaticum TaxID=2751 RepID=UPI0009C9B977|nr:hypothetical protein BN1423_1070014 [Carnobacterium maltaromaticum]